MVSFPTPPIPTRIGFHYFPDADHFREDDLKTWLPRLQSLGAAWLILLAPPGRAIPEAFLGGLMRGGIEPVLHFPLPLGAPPASEELTVLFETYARWGVHYAILFDRPNSRFSWPSSAWAKSDLVERFLDRFLPLAEMASNAGLHPVFPPLEPGGGYWDTSFLRAALQSMERRGRARVLERLALAAYAPSGERPLNWGCGGPERWPGTRPYFTPSGAEDQRGLHIFDWYGAIARAVIGEALPMLLLGLGSFRSGATTGKAAHLSEDEHLRRNLAIAAALAGVGPLPTPVEALEPLPEQVLAGNFWLLSAAPENPHLPRAWFDPLGAPRPTAEAFRRWAAEALREHAGSRRKSAGGEGAARRPIRHYLLLPCGDWNVVEWHLNAVRPFIQKYLPAIGFSLAEAACAERVTVAGDVHDFSESALDELRFAGCLVERLGGDGTSIASMLTDVQETEPWPREATR